MLNEDTKLNFNINKKRENLNSELEYINNTEDEILEATKEMEILIKNNFNQSSISENCIISLHSGLCTSGGRTWALILPQ